jgi:hypothetical protein
VLPTSSEGLMGVGIAEGWVFRGVTRHGKMGESPLSERSVACVVQRCRGGRPRRFFLFNVPATAAASLSSCNRMLR